MDDHHKLIAKIQHFYEVMVHRIDEVDDYNFSHLNNPNMEQKKENSMQLKSLANEYSKIFEAFLYKESV